MTAEIAHDTPEQPVAPPIEQQHGILLPIEDRIRERPLADDERAMVHGFYGFAERNGINPRTIEKDDMPRLADVTHLFLHDVATRRVKTGPQNTTLDLKVMPLEPVQRRLHAYYERFGTNRRGKSDRLREIEESFIAEKKRPLLANVYIGGEEDADGYVGEIQKVPRAAFFPEVGIGLRLEEALRKMRYELAADSVEAVIAAYGARFLDLVRDAGKQGVLRVPDRGPHNIIRPNVSDLPEDAQPERYRPRPR